jgi:predicted nucleotidyltransferase component of viral defense system
MNKWIAESDETKRKAYVQIAEKIGMSPFAVEKDWWVTRTLSIIFDMEIGKHLIFKGGTSLSKAFNLIERFSEDIDLAVDREYFGYAGELTKKERQRLRKVSGKYVDEVFYPDLKVKFQEKGLHNARVELVEEVESDKDRTINIFYPNVIASPGYLAPKVQLEIGSRSLKEPFTFKTISSLVDEAYPSSDFAQDAFQVPTVNPERTLLEKIFLLHEEFQRPAERMRVNRLSRHLYDIFKLSQSPYAEKAFTNPELYQTIVEHRYKFNRIGHIDYNLHQPQTISMLPPERVLADWKADYETMLEQMIYEENAPSFDKLIVELKKLNDKINSLGWKFDFDFSIKK